MNDVKIFKFCEKNMNLDQKVQQKRKRCSLEACRAGAPWGLACTPGLGAATGGGLRAPEDGGCWEGLGQGFWS